MKKSIFAKHLTREHHPRQPRPVPKLEPTGSTPVLGSRFPAPAAAAGRSHPALYTIGYTRGRMITLCHPPSSFCCSPSPAGSTVGSRKGHLPLGDQAGPSIGAPVRCRNKIDTKLRILGLPSTDAAESPHGRSVRHALQAHSAICDQCSPQGISGLLGLNFTQHFLTGRPAPAGEGPPGCPDL